MISAKKQNLKLAPTFLVAILITIGAALKITGYHPMLHHFIEMGIGHYLAVLGSLEILFVLLFLLPSTSKLGLLLLTGYFGGAMAAELPYHQVLAPAVPLTFVWLAAFVRQPSFFLAPASANQLTPSLKHKHHETFN